MTDTGSQCYMLYQMPRHRARAICEEADINLLIGTNSTRHLAPGPRWAEAADTAPALVKMTSELELGWTFWQEHGWLQLRKVYLAWDSNFLSLLTSGLSVGLSITSLVLQTIITVIISIYWAFTMWQSSFKMPYVCFPLNYSSRIMQSSSVLDSQVACN
jgi:hypothetical protein